jgi:hypothetical protein
VAAAKGKNSIAEFLGGEAHGDQHVSLYYVVEDEQKQLAEPALAA